MSNGWNLYSLRYSIDQIRTKIIIYKQIDNTKTKQYVCLSGLECDGDKNCVDGSDEVNYENDIVTLSKDRDIWFHF